MIMVSFGLCLLKGCGFVRAKRGTPGHLLHGLLKFALNIGKPVSASNITPLQVTKVFPIIVVGREPGTTSARYFFYSLHTILSLPNAYSFVGFVANLKDDRAYVINAIDVTK